MTALRALALGVLLLVALVVGACMLYMQVHREKTATQDAFLSPRTIKSSAEQDASSTDLRRRLDELERRLERLERQLHDREQSSSIGK